MKNCRKTAGCAFTLIELLVVITIIVILLALLTPALDKAIYQAELATCSGKIKSAASAVTSYAMDSQRSYPYRGIRDKKAGDAARWLSAMALAKPDQFYDARPSLKGIMDVTQSMQCPFSYDGIDLVNTDPDVNVEASYVFFWDWQYKSPVTVKAGDEELPGFVSANDDGQPGMFRYGDSWGYNLKSYSILIGDIDLRYPDGVQSSHPDRDPGNMSFIRAEDEILFGFRSRVSRWRYGNPGTPVDNAGQQGNGPRDCGFRDLNYGYDDGSVSRYDSVKNWLVQDERMDRVPIQFDSRRNGDSLNVPDPVRR